MLIPYHGMTLYLCNTNMPTIPPLLVTFFVKEDTIIVIKYNMLIPAIMELLFVIILNCVYTYAYIQLSSTLKENIISSCFLTYTISSWISSGLSFLRIMNIIQHFGEEIFFGIWHTTMLSETKCPYKLLKIFNMVCAGLGCYFCFNMVSFFTTCGIYNDSYIACTSMKIIIIITILFLIPFSLGIIFVFCFPCYFCYLFCYFCCLYNEGNRQITNERYTYAYTIVNYLNRYNPISNLSSDTTCPICLMQADEKSANWTQLLCGHKFHTYCISKWLSNHQTCPCCRKPIDLSLLQNRV
jgi:hypothetical protein